MPTHSDKQFSQQLGHIAGFLEKHENGRSLSDPNRAFARSKKSSGRYELALELPKRKRNQYFGNLYGPVLRVRGKSFLGGSVHTAEPPITEEENLGSLKKSIVDIVGTESMNSAANANVFSRLHPAEQHRVTGRLSMLPERRANTRV